MKNYFLTLALCLTTTFSLSAASRIDLGVEDNKVTKQNVVSVWATWIKDKGKKYDLDFNLRNERDKGIILMANEIHCYRGKEEGVAKVSGDTTMHFRAGELKNPGFTCKLSTSESGEYRVTIGKIYENLSSDGKTLGKVISQGLEWKLKLAQ